MICLKVNLMKRGILYSYLFDQCRMALEDSTHALYRCQALCSVWVDHCPKVLVLLDVVVGFANMVWDLMVTDLACVPFFLTIAWGYGSIEITFYFNKMIVWLRNSLIILLHMLIVTWLLSHVNAKNRTTDQKRKKSHSQPALMIWDSISSLEPAMI